MAQTFIYATKNGVDIGADVYLPKSVNKPVPILLFYHGGGLLLGSMASVNPHMRNAVDKYSICVVSADYRLAPQVKVPAIIEDVQDCVEWIRNDLDGLLGGNKIDTSRLAISGASAGGYLALLGGALVKPAIQCVLAIYPITNALGEFFTTVQPPVDDSPLPKAQWINPESMKDVLDPKSQVVSWSKKDKGIPKPRDDFYSYMLQQANLGELIYDDPKKDGDKYRIANLIDSSFPPTYLITSIRDTRVGPEQSQEVDEALEKANIDHRFDVLEDPSLDHGFDSDPSVNLESMYNFLLSHL